MIKKIVISIIVVAILALFFVGYSHFIGFEAWTKQTRADFGVISILNKLGFFIFIIFGILSLLKYISPGLINRYVTNGIGDLTYIIVFCTTLTLIIPLIIFRVSFCWFFWHYSAISFIYIFGLTTICIKMFNL